MNRNANRLIYSRVILERGSCPLLTLGSASVKRGRDNSTAWRAAVRTKLRHPRRCRATYSLEFALGYPIAVSIHRAQSSESQRLSGASTASRLHLSPGQRLGEAREQAENARAPFELIDAPELARRWNLPASWIREQTRSRSIDPIPHLRLGRYVRFEWGSPDLEAWLTRRRFRRA